MQGVDERHEDDGAIRDREGRLGVSHGNLATLEIVFLVKNDLVVNKKSNQWFEPCRSDS